MLRALFQNYHVAKGSRGADIKDVDHSGVLSHLHTAEERSSEWRRRPFFPFAFCLVLLLASVSAKGLPGSLGDADVDRVVEVVGIGGATRLLRSAEAYESWPGMKFGFEVLMVPTRNLNSLGDGTGTLPGLLPTPRLYLAKGLFSELELILNFFPPSDVNRIATLGLLVKYTFFQEKDSWLSAAFYGAYTRIKGFEGKYKGTDIEVGMVVSKDLVRLKPYVSLGALLASGSVSPDIVSTPKTSSSFSTLHIAIGTEVDYPIHFAGQIDFWNLSLGASFFVGKKF